MSLGAPEFYCIECKRFFDWKLVADNPQHFTALSGMLRQSEPTFCPCCGGFYSVYPATFWPALDDRALCTMEAQYAAKKIA